MKKNLPCQRRGFTLMEVIVSLAIIITAIISIITLISFSISGIAANKSKIISFGLAQEGLEIVRNIRDNNWLSNKRLESNWRDGLLAGNYIVQYNSASLVTFSSVPLKLNSNGFYQYSSGTNTNFYRKIIISDVDANQFKTVVEVTWQEKGRSQITKAESRLYNWSKDEEIEE